MPVVSKTGSGLVPASFDVDLVPSLEASGGNTVGPLWASIIASVDVAFNASGSLVCEVKWTDANGLEVAQTTSVSLSDAATASAAMGPFIVMRNSLLTPFKVQFTLMGEPANAIFDYAVNMVRFT